MRILLLTMATLLASPGIAHAINCSAPAPNLPLRATALAPVATELEPPRSPLGVRGGVLSRAYDEAQSVDQVLFRLRVEGCQAVAMAIPTPSVIDPNDPAAYKPKTEFDNTPWRFDMSQNGKRMTADEFSAWMKAKGVRVARGAGAPAGVPATAPVPAPGVGPASAPPQSPGVAPGMAPGTLPSIAPAAPVAVPVPEPVPSATPTP